MTPPVLQLKGKMSRRDEQRKLDLDLESTEDDAFDDLFSDESSFHGRQHALSLSHVPFANWAQETRT